MERENVHSKDSDLLARTNLGADERAEGGDSSAQHRGGHLSGDVIWDLEGEVLVGSDVAGIATLSNGTVGIWSIVGI